jgi:hypothetical protein
MKYTRTFFRCDGDHCGAEMDCGGVPSAEEWRDLRDHNGWTRAGEQHFCFACSLHRQLMGLPDSPFYAIVETREDGDHIIEYRDNREQFYGCAGFGNYFSAYRSGMRRQRIVDCHWTAPADPLRVRAVALRADPELEENHE